MRAWGTFTVLYMTRKYDTNEALKEHFRKQRKSAYYVSLYQIRTWHEIYVQIQRTTRRNAVKEKTTLYTDILPGNRKRLRIEQERKAKLQTEAQQAVAMLNAHS